MKLGLPWQPSKRVVQQQLMAERERQRIYSSKLSCKRNEGDSDDEAPLILVFEFYGLEV